MIIAINAISAKDGGMLTYTLSFIDYLIKLEGIDIFHVWVPLKLPRYSIESLILNKMKTNYYFHLICYLYDQIILRNEIKKNKTDFIILFASIELNFSHCSQFLLPIYNNIIRYSNRFSNNLNNYEK